MNTITIPASRARADFYDLLEEAGLRLRKIAITLRGKVKAILMSPDEVEGWEETMKIMSDPKAYQELKEGIAQMERGKLISHKDLMKKLGLTK
jgi:PHD/YefM family antitoxin component YafN of YafNO toxin-antitoxin module